MEFRIAFRDVEIDELFKVNGNWWRKRSSRTAVPIDKRNMPRFSYFGLQEIALVRRAA